MDFLLKKKNVFRHVKNLISFFLKIALTSMCKTDRKGQHRK